MTKPWKGCAKCKRPVNYVGYYTIRDDKRNFCSPWCRDSEFLGEKLTEKLKIRSTCMHCGRSKTNTNSLYCDVCIVLSPMLPQPKKKDNDNASKPPESAVRSIDKRRGDTTTPHRHRRTVGKKKQSRKRK